MQSVQFGMQNRTFGPYLAAIDRDPHPRNGQRGRGSCNGWAIEDGVVSVCLPGRHHGVVLKMAWRLSVCLPGRRSITVSYAYKKDTKGERHGTPAERLLAAQQRAKQAQQNRPNTLFATGALRGGAACVTGNWRILRVVAAQQGPQESCCACPIGHTVSY
jgi:hypothetical protein